MKPSIRLVIFETIKELSVGAINDKYKRKEDIDVVLNSEGCVRIKQISGLFRSRKKILVEMWNSKKYNNVKNEIEFAFMFLQKENFFTKCEIVVNDAKIKCYRIN